ncbi:hypothetical protein ABW19_dt0202292 [Dactylella cylindrospora]|nr:hypothetical protein ABW19_dt0202292 [Dactylella cylindrospora]
MFTILLLPWFILALGVNVVSARIVGLKDIDKSRLYPDTNPDHYATFTYTYTYKSTSTKKASLSTLLYYSRKPTTTRSSYPTPLYTSSGDDLRARAIPETISFAGNPDNYTVLQNLDKKRFPDMSSQNGHFFKHSFARAGRVSMGFDAVGLGIDYKNSIAIPRSDPVLLGQHTEFGKFPKGNRDDWLKGGANNDLGLDLKIKLNPPVEGAIGDVRKLFQIYFRTLRNTQIKKKIRKRSGRKITIEEVYWDLNIFNTNFFALSKKLRKQLAPDLQKLYKSDRVCFWLHPQINILDPDEMIRCSNYTRLPGWAKRLRLGVLEDHMEKVEKGKIKPRHWKTCGPTTSWSSSTFSTRYWVAYNEAIFGA